MNIGHSEEQSGLLKLNTVNWYSFTHSFADPVGTTLYISLAWQHETRWRTLCSETVTLLQSSELVLGYIIPYIVHVKTLWKSLPTHKSSHLAHHALPIVRILPVWLKHSKRPDGRGSGASPVDVLALQRGKGGDCWRCFMLSAKPAAKTQTKQSIYMTCTWIALFVSGSDQNHCRWFIYLFITASHSTVRTPANTKREGVSQPRQGRENGRRRKKGCLSNTYWGQEIQLNSAAHIS